MLDPGFEGDRYFSELNYLVHLSFDKLFGIEWSFTCDRPVDLTVAYRPGRRSILRSILAWATFGLVVPNNCVTAVVDRLRHAGYDVPRNLVTPAHLYDWLRKEGTFEQKHEAVGL